VTRFAPSPTGGLHRGHGWSAILAHDRARAAGGRFILRIEDIDGTRSRPEHVETILADLKWLGLRWHALSFQSQRLDEYRAALDRLAAMGLLYPCFCTRADIAREIAASMSAPHGPDGAPYPGTCRLLSPAERARRVRHEPHAWRIDISAAIARVGRLDWTDELAGTIAADPAPAGDVVLARKDAPASYHLAVTVDDAAQGVTHVIRGADLFAATHVHRLLQALLALPTPVYHHYPLITDARGKRLAKRDGAPMLADHRAAGVDGHAFAAQLRTDMGLGLPLALPNETIKEDQ
ncbi:MAG: tRNA glutamyl-Q(34) synthetase GluQRS, partial [Sphingomonas sp.]|nr:tRNA glutamyl-Q(34) synthetase GluQRS [Sphingomonas sp.]